MTGGFAKFGAAGGRIDASVIDAVGRLRRNIAAGRVRRPLAFTRVAPIVLVLVCNAGLADTEIHRCLLEDGTVAFQEMPCPEPAPPGEKAQEAGNEGEGRAEAAANEPPAGSSPAEEQAGQGRPAGPQAPESVSKDRGECEKAARDAIDAVDLELREDATGERRRDYLAKLLALMEQLRDCKQL